MKGKNVYIKWDGCNRRILDTTKVKNYFILNGYKIVNKPNKADFIFLTTCAFKEKEENNSIASINRLKKYNKKILIHGCLPDIAPTKFAKYSNFEYLAPRNIEQIDNLVKETKIKFSELKDANLIDLYHNSNLFTTALKKIFSNFIFSQDFFKHLNDSAKKVIKNSYKTSRDYYLFICRGCSGKCSYCNIKYAIGPCKSKSIEKVVEELECGINDGYKNIIILGDDVGCYGQDINSSFPELLDVLIERIEAFSRNGLARSRNGHKIKIEIRELHPKWIVRYGDQLIDLVKSENIASILSPIESGSNRILELMKREHTVEEFQAVISKLRQINPYIKWDTQIILGFPSETAADFEQTLDFVKKADFHSVIIFPYHEKENTISSSLPIKIHPAVIEYRINKAKKYFKRHKIKVFMSCPY